MRSNLNTDFWLCFFFFLIYEFYFWQISPLPSKWTFQNMAWIIFWVYSSAKDNLRNAKTWYFPSSAFCSAGQWAGYSPPDYAIKYITIKALNRHGSVLQCHKPKWKAQVRHPAVLHDMNREKQSAVFLYNTLFTEVLLFNNVYLSRI